MCDIGDLGKHLIRSFVHISNSEDHRPFHPAAVCTPQRHGQIQYLCFTIEREIAHISYKHFGSTAFGALQAMIADVEFLVKQ